MARILIAMFYDFYRRIWFITLVENYATHEHSKNLQSHELQFNNKGEVDNIEYKNINIGLVNTKSLTLTVFLHWKQ